MLTTEERSRRIKEGLARARDEGRIGGKKRLIDETEGRRYAEMCVRGEIQTQEAARLLGVTNATFFRFRETHGFSRKVQKYASKHIKARTYKKGEHRQKMPDERGLKALREYYAKECTLRDVCEYCGVCYATAKRWTTQGLGKESA